MRKLALLLLLASALLLNACSSGGSDSPADTNVHPESWFSTHNADALASLDYGECKTCHGTDLHGSGGAVSCYSCHSYNTTPPFSYHPTSWTNPYFDHGPFVRVNDTGSCETCHGQNLQGYQTAPSCYSSSFDGRGCHQDGPGGAPHPVNANWLLPIGTNISSHVLSSINDDTSCTRCHIDGGINPACSQCHTAGAPNGSVGTCASCHNNPPDSALAAGGDSRPNRVGAHSEHNALTAQTSNCSACHNGAGTNTLNHYDTTEPANIAFVGTTYNAKTGTAGYNATAETCSKVSCHGGQTSPVWLTATLDVNTQCSSCHELGTAAKTPEFNSYYSGGHSTHVSRTDCFVCHDVGKLATDHFADLNTPAFDGEPALTIADVIGYDVPNSTCTTNVAGCHSGQTRNWAAGGGVPHPVNAAWLLPSGTDSSSHVLASITNNTSCLDCHVSGATDPACSQCHTANDPNYIVGTCDSCHNNPPNSAVAAGGDLRPNREGAHSGHNALPKVTNVCATCHNGAGTNTTSHYDTTEPADVAFVGTTYNAKTGTASYTPLSDSCNNVSCHGGQTTPNWLTGSLNVNTQCASCHALAPTQYNGYSNPDDRSHTYHIVTRGVACTSCHNTSTLSTNHFTNLDTQIMEGPASGTIGGGSTSIPSNLWLPATRSCDPSCHDQQTW